MLSDVPGSPEEITEGEKRQKRNHGAEKRKRTGREHAGTGVPCPELCTVYTETQDKQQSQ